MKKNSHRPSPRGVKPRARRSLVSSSGWLRLWAAVHPQPALPIEHPIPKLALPPVPAPRKARRSGDSSPALHDLLARLLGIWLGLALLATGCAATRPLKGGKAVTTRKPAGGLEQSLVQSQNAAEAATQVQETVKVRTYTVPAGSRLEEARVTAMPPGVPLTNVQHVVVSAPMPVVEREECRARSELGAAQKDTARELGARLASLKGVVWVGVGLFVFGLASLVWPPLKALIGSVTTSLTLALGGVALMVVPTLVAGNELLILGVVALSVGAWFLAHRHGHLRGMLAGKSQNGAD